MIKRLLNRYAVGALALSATGLISLASFEGFRSEAYIPVPGDVPTIGFGSTTGVKLGDKITVQEGLIRLMRDASVYEAGIKKCVKVPLSQNEYDAFASFSYNVGTTAFCTSTLVKKLNAGDYDGACKELLRWNGMTIVKPNGEKQFTVIQGLVNRRQKEYDLCMQR
jgi:lysozyme